MLPPLLKLLRPTDWAKNVFVLVPAVFWLAGDGKGAPPEEVRAQMVRVSLAFVAFSLAGSGFYALNDVLDAAEDRKHPTKRLRPVASGTVSPGTALVAGAVLLAGAFAVAAQVGKGLGWCIGIYSVVQVAYNARLKRVRLVDVVTVASGFVLRAVAGALALSIGVSAWLVVVVFGLTLFLGFAKRLGDLRAAELARARGEAIAWKPRAGYDSADELNWLLATTAAVTMMSYILYALSDHARGIFGARATGFALLAPMVLVVLHRLYLRAHQGKAGNPVGAILVDRGAFAATVVFAVGVVLVLFWPPVEHALRTVFR